MVTPRPGDVVQVGPGRAACGRSFSGCVLTYVGSEPRLSGRGVWHLCENSYGHECREFEGKRVNVIRVREVTLLRARPVGGWA